jgi:hypothetical protein
MMPITRLDQPVLWLVEVGWMFATSSAAIPFFHFFRSYWEGMEKLVNFADVTIGLLEFSRLYGRRD